MYNNSGRGVERSTSENETRKFKKKEKRTSGLSVFDYK